MGDFATEIMCFQPNSVFYVKSRLWSPPSSLSSDEAPSCNSSEYRWREACVDRKLLFSDRGQHSTNSSDSEYKYYEPRRVSSLKTQRTPSGTTKSKAVRFADALGLDLEDVRHVFNLDLPPKIPASAVKDLRLVDEIATDRVLHLVANFVQPGSTSDFLRRVRMHNVCLENAIVLADVLSGTVRVMNLSFDKTVIVRISFNEWIDQTEVQARYVPGSHDGATDRFVFSVPLPSSCQTYGHRVQFAVAFQSANGTTYWDNNFGQNYIFNCVSDSLLSLHHN